MAIDSKTRLITLLGYPLGHSLSPLIHNTALEAQHVNMVYLCMPVPADHFRQAVQGLSRVGWVGSNVTIPHKQHAFELADELSERAQAVGAVNTLVLTEGNGAEGPHLYGDNTDIKGFSDTLIEYHTQIQGGDVVVVGSGGSARAIVYALLTDYQPRHLTIAARSVKKAERLALAMNQYDTRDSLRTADIKHSEDSIRGCTLLVNTTPVGMHPNAHVSPVENAALLDDVEIVYDLIYNPQKTELLSEAEKRGAVVIGGLEMLIRQAAASYVQWTGQEMPLDQVRNVVQEHLK
ncbi:MAG: shikimate dehydrogenase [Rhodothermaceae bacterium]|nr:shikimate dehydrogenase [Rhodothermaceae bacterium]